MTALLASVLVASFVGSLHCAGMCGPLVVFCGGGVRPQARELMAYHSARLIGYVLLGALAGGLGAALDLGGQAAGFGRTAAVLAGAFMVVCGLAGLRGSRTGRKPGKASLVITRLMGRASRLDGMQRSLWIGGLTGLLPCGWLYAFLAVAAGTGSMAWGGLAMVAFWAGSVPVLLGVGVGAGSLLGPLRSRAPVVVSVLLVTLGLFTVSGRFSVPSFEEAGVAAVGVRALAGESADGQLPCCAADEGSTGEQ